MSEDLDARLRDALRPVAPRSELTEALIARLGGNQNSNAGHEPGGRHDGKDAAPAIAAPVSRVPPTRRLQRPVWWLPLGLAASLLLAVGIQGAHEREQREKGMEARRQVFEALRVTNQKLDLVARAVREESKS
jgi:hypothetical protein